MQIGRAAPRRLLDEFLEDPRTGHHICREAGPQLSSQAFPQRIVNSGGRIERETRRGAGRSAVGFGASRRRPARRPESALDDLAGRGDGHLVQHLQPPRFTARVVYTDPDGLPLDEEIPADVLSGIVYVADGGDPEGDVLLCEIAWIDTPDPGEVTPLLEAASDAFEAWDDSDD